MNNFSTHDYNDSDMPINMNSKIGTSRVFSNGEAPADIFS